MLQIIISLFLLFQHAPEFYSYTFKDINGKTVKMASFRGKKVLIVNTASACGYTPQYADLEALHKKYGKKLVVLGFPANNFGGQEPGTEEQIKSFCTSKYHITFLLAEKTSVAGKDVAPLFQWLTEQDNPDFTGEIKWNFEKFLIDEKGKLIHRYRSKVKPLDKVLTDAI